MYHVALLLLRDVDDYCFLKNTYQNIMPRTEDRSADFASADPYTRDGNTSCVYLLFTYLPLVFKHTFQI